jgi:hypothetical protein
VLGLEEVLFVVRRAQFAFCVCLLVDLGLTINV